MKRHLHRWLVSAVLALSLAPPAGAAETTPATAGTVSLPSDIPVRREAPTESSNGGRTVFIVWSLVALGALAWVAIGWSRRQRGTAEDAPRGPWQLGLTRLFGRASAADLRVLSSARLSTRHSVHVVAWRNTEYLVGCSEQGLTLLDQRGTPGGAAAAESATP